MLSLVVEKGSIAIDGISLTVAALGKDDLTVSVIPHTGSETTLLGKRPGDRVNLENDIIGKYVKRLMQTSPEEEKTSGVTEEMLAEYGFI